MEWWINHETSWTIFGLIEHCKKIARFEFVRPSINGRSLDCTESQIDRHPKNQSFYYFPKIMHLWQYAKSKCGSFHMIGNRTFYQTYTKLTKPNLSPGINPFGNTIKRFINNNLVRSEVCLWMKVPAVQLSIWRSVLSGPDFKNVQIKQRYQMRLPESLQPKKSQCFKMKNAIFWKKRVRGDFGNFLVWQLNLNSQVALSKRYLTGGQ